MREKLKEVSTEELVSELFNREGVKGIIAEPYQQLNLPVNGPAIVLVVVD